MAKERKTPPAAPDPGRVAVADRTAALPLTLRVSPTSDPAAWRAAGGHPTCEGCVAHCCRYVCVEIDRPRAKWQYDQIHWMLLHADVAVFEGPDGKWFTEFRTRCSQLTAENRCAAYASRPALCRSYEVENCPVWNEGDQHRVRFESAEEFAAWLDGRRIDWRYKNGRPERVAPDGRPLPPPRRRPPARAPGPARSGGAGRGRGRSPRG